MRDPRQVLPHSLIYERVWGYDFGPPPTRSRVYIGYLRRKLEDAGARDLIHKCAAWATCSGSPEPMTLRGRIAGVASLAVALAVMAAAVSLYVAVRTDLRGEVDSQLRSLPACSLRGRAPGSVRPIPMTAIGPAVRRRGSPAGCSRAR